MCKLSLRSALFATVSVAVPLLLSAGALAQVSAAPGKTALPAPKVMTPSVQLQSGPQNSPQGAPANAPAEALAPAAAAPAPAAATPTAPQIQEGVAAVVNDDVITSYDLGQRMKLLVVTSGVQVTDADIPQLEQEARRSLIDEHLQRQEIGRMAKKQKSKDFIADDKEVDQEISDIAKQNNMNFAQMKSQFTAAGIDFQGLREQIRTQITWQRLVGGVYGHQIRVGAEQVNKALARLSNQASQTQYQVQEIFLETNRAGGMDKAMAGAAQLVAYIQKGTPFSNVAREFSSDSSAANGGDLGWVTASDLPPEVAKVVELMRPGQLSQPIPVGEGVYIVLLRDRQAASGQTMVALKQAAVRLDKDATAEQINAASAALKAIKPQIKGCDNIEQVAGKTPGVISADLGEADIAELRGPFKDAAEKLQAGQVSDPIRTDVGLHLVAVCSKHSGSNKLPSRNEIENRLYGEQLSVMQRRYLRDLRTSATIEAR